MNSPKGVSGLLRVAVEDARHQLLRHGFGQHLAAILGQAQPLLLGQGGVGVSGGGGVALIVRQGGGQRRRAARLQGSGPREA